MCVIVFFAHTLVTYLVTYVYVMPLLIQIMACVNNEKKNKRDNHSKVS